MGFSLEPQRERLQERGIQGSFRNVAVMCWFTSSGKAIPIMIKYEDEDGVRHTVNPIETVSYDKKFYAGIYALKYKCRAEFAGIMKEFILMFHPDGTTWEMTISEQS